MKKRTVVYVSLVAIIGATLACSLGSEDANAVASSRIEAATGGSLTSQDGALTIEIPPGALSEDTEISIRAVPKEDLPDELAELEGADDGYLLQPDGLTFEDPITVTWEIDPADLVVEGQEGFHAQAIVSWSEQTGLEPLEDLSTEVSLKENRAITSGALDHFSWITREDGALEVTLVEANDEQIVGTSFNTLVEFGIGVRMHGVVLADIGGNFIASGQVSLAGNGSFEAGNLGYYERFSDVTGMYRCNSEPGPGTYGATVHALVTWEAGPSSADRVLQVTVTSGVNCIAEPVPTEPSSTLGISNILIEMGYSADAVNRIEDARRQDNREDWLYSISELPPMLRWDYLDLLEFEGLITDAELDQVEEWFNDTLFPCGEIANGRLTVCGVTVRDFPAGDMLIFTGSFDGIIPLDDPDHHLVFAVVLDGDGDPANNFQFIPPYDWDYYQGTDQWYELGWNPQMGEWFLTLMLVRGSLFLELHTDARAVIAGDTIVFFIPAAEVDVEMPAFRITSFGHDGTFAHNASGGDVSGANPTEPLIPLTLRLD
ncbi:MAG TPA: hypothetical protein G4O08_09600 [Anaerolineae bacterium]|nr:hypothetical protein [Anaerolineae bacterium]